MRTLLWVMLFCGGLLRGQTPTHIFIFAGQSNAQGYGNRIQLSPVPAWAQNTANGWVGRAATSPDTGTAYQHPTVANLNIPLFNQNNTGGLGGQLDSWRNFSDTDASSAWTSYGPELSFLWKYRADNPTTPIAVLKVVLGGSSLANDWLNGTMDTVFAAALSQAAARLTGAGTSYVWDTMIWMQGESGAAATNCAGFDPNTPTQYATDLRTFISRTRGRTSAGLRVGIGRISNSMLCDWIILPISTPISGGCTPAQNRQVGERRRADQVLVAGDAGNFWWDNDNLPILPDTVHPEWQYHFTNDGYLAMGERAYNAWLTSNPYPVGRKAISHSGRVTAGNGVSIR